MHLTTNPPSAPKRGKKSARKWDARVRDYPLKRWSIFGLRASSNRAPYIPDQAFTDFRRVGLRGDGPFRVKSDIAACSQLRASRQMRKHTRAEIISPNSLARGSSSRKELEQTQAFLAAIEDETEPEVGPGGSRRIEIGIGDGRRAARPSGR